MKTKILAIIPARGGSKGIKLKNIRKINKIPLIVNTANRLKKSKLVNEIICSTDNAKIISICKKNSIRYLKRAKKLSLDNTNINDVIYDILIKEEFSKFDFIILAQPTNPFINEIFINKILNKIKNSKFDSVQTVIKTPHMFHPYNQRKITNNKISFLYKKKRELNFNKQKKPNFYSFGNLVIFKRKSFLKKRKVFCEPSGYIELNKTIFAHDVDFVEDLILANIIQKKFRI